jgi:hypothetical protein
MTKNLMTNSAPSHVLAVSKNTCSVDVELVYPRVLCLTYRFAKQMAGWEPEGVVRVILSKC